MARLKIEYGIDLGTTNSGIARMESGVSNMLEIDRSKTIPSAVIIKTLRGDRRRGRSSCTYQFDCCCSGNDRSVLSIQSLRH